MAQKACKFGAPRRIDFGMSGVGGGGGGGLRRKVGALAETARTPYLRLQDVQ